MSARCVSCGSSVEAEDAFCGNCGHAVRADSPQARPLARPEQDQRARAHWEVQPDAQVGAAKRQEPTPAEVPGTMEYAECAAQAAPR